MIRCEAEMCRNWTGQGCACEFLGMERDVVREHRCGCDGCWACTGRVVDCTCDVDWDDVFGSRI